MITEAEKKRFDSKWISEGECHLWQGPLDKDGYGTFFFRRRSRRAHRAAYYITLGDIPEGMVIDHICKNRHCVNVAHLRVITKRENALVNSNSPAAKNALRVNCLKGHPFDRVYGKQRYCSICEIAKTKRLRQQWRAADTIKC